MFMLSSCLDDNKNNMPITFQSPLLRFSSLLVATTLLQALSLVPVVTTHGWGTRNNNRDCQPNRQTALLSASSLSPDSSVAAEAITPRSSAADTFESFVEFLLEQQTTIIEEIEQTEASYGQTTNTFTRDAWGAFGEQDGDNSGGSSSSSSNGNNDGGGGSGGLTRVLQGGAVVEKGACSITVIRNGILTSERAAAISGRQQQQQTVVRGGDSYSAAALSMVLHSRNPHVPTFRSDVRIFLVQSSSDGNDSSSSSSASQSNSMAWFGGGADLTPYYLYDDDITTFHSMYKDLCDEKFPERSNDDDSEMDNFSYPAMKRSCDDYFFLPARAEHRGVGGIFFDDMPVSENSLSFCQDMVKTWMPSWIPVAVKNRQGLPFTEQQKQWQCIRRGRYLEFNLLYDRGVKFGLAKSPNPRVEGVMVSAPPMIAFEYNHEVEPDTPEADLLAILKEPRDWVK